MWLDPDARKIALDTANFLAKSDLLPPVYKGQPANIMIALDISNRTGIEPLMVMQNLYVVKGRPAWNGQMCISIVNGSGRFTPLEFEFVGTMGEDDYGCYAHAVRKDNGKEYASDIITVGMAKAEGWYAKDGSKWRTMPRQMMMYRAGTFFARVHCPDLLLGIHTMDEVNDSDNGESDLKSILEEE